VYQAYSDYRGMMTLVQELMRHLVRDVVKPTEAEGEGENAPQRPSMRIKHAASGEWIDFGAEWREVKYKDLIIEKTGDAQWFSRTKDEKIAGLQKLGLFADAKWEEFELTNEIFGKLIEPTLIQPTFVTHLPKELCPLAKITPNDPTTIDVFELIIGGMEIAPAYSEQNDPDVQRQMFEAQAGEEQQKVDHDFLLALEHGMPPAGGMGIGIDRLCILLTGAESIRDVILYPQLRQAKAE
jgi:lysyl-tRNA synthetase class 2